MNSELDPSEPSKTDEIEAAEQAAEQAALVEAANEATHASNTAMILADESALHLHHMQYLAQSTAIDAIVWDSIVVALEALPPDATHQQIALAEAKAVAAAKKRISHNLRDEMPKASEEAVRDALDAQAKERIASDARSKVSPLGGYGLLGLILGGFALSAGLGITSKLKRPIGGQP